MTTIFAIMKKERLYCAFSYNVHDSSVAFSIEDRVVLVLEAERVFRQKRKRCDMDEMEYLIRYGLNYLSKKEDDIAGWAMTTLQNPILWNEQINVFKEDNTPKDPFWKEFNILGAKRNILVVNHHLSHAATYYFSNFSDAVIVTCDGGGDSECVAAFTANNENIERLNTNLDGFINGKFYGACSFYLYRDLHCEGKMMALSAFGTPQENMINRLIRIMPQLNSLNYPDSVKIIENEFPEIKLNSGTLLDREKVDFSASVQKLFSDHRVSDILKIIHESERHSTNLVMAGGASLNLDTNSEILHRISDMNQFVAPCCDDTGQSLGALSVLIVNEFGHRPRVELPYLGMGAESFSYNRQAVDTAVDILLHDGIVILHNGKAEIGPRALGNRSFIARPDSVRIKKILSEEIKQRESYRPVAPVVIQEKTGEYFSGPKSSPFMLYKYDVLQSKRKQIEGAVHCDGSARVQTVNRQTNPFLHELISKFGDKSGIYVLLNTSLNLKGNPIANTIEDSLDIYNKIKAPKLLIHDGHVEKPDQVSDETRTR